MEKKLDDPYTIENIKAALLSLINQNTLGLAKKSQSSMDSLVIKPNYLYVRGVVEDLIDANTSYARRYNTTGLDLVQGFTIKQVENAVVESFSFNELRDKLKAKYPSGSTAGLVYTNTDFDNLFSYWGSL